MRLLVIGGTRGCGREVVSQGSARGHDITLLARQPQRAPSAARLTVIEGDARDARLMRGAVQDQDAVLVCLGVRPTRRPVQLFSDALRVIIDGMRCADVERLLYVSGIGSGDSRGHGGFWYDHLLLPVLHRTVQVDKERAEALVAGSGLRWTICRPGFLTNGPMLARYRIFTQLKAVPRFRAGSIARADIAHFLLDEVERNEFVGKSPLVCY